MEVLVFFGYVAVLFFTYLLLRRLIGSLTISGLERRAVLITGCDSGFGHLLALKCLSHGMPVFAGCLTNKGAEELKSKSLGKKASLRTVLMDVTSDDSVKAAVDAIDAEARSYGGLHAIVNNAGIVGHSFYDDFLTIQDYHKVGEVNLWGAIRVSHATKNLVKMAKGRIINMLSICSRVGIQGIGPYTVAKFGLSGYSDVLRQEMRSFGVSVHVLEPGFFATHLTSSQNTQKSMQDAWNDAPTEIKKMYGQKFYKEGIEQSVRLIDSLKSPNVEWVVDSYFHAVTALFPRFRYQMGWDGILFFIPFSFLPSFVQDFFFRLLDKVVKMPLPQSVTDPNWCF